MEKQLRRLNKHLMKSKLKKYKYKKPALFLCAGFFIVSFLLAAFLVSPPSAEALTNQQAERRAEAYCKKYDGLSSLFKDACIRGYEAGAKGEKKPDSCDDESCEEGYDEGKKANEDSKDPNKSGGGDRQEAEGYCSKHDGTSRIAKDDCIRGYVAGAGGKKKPDNCSGSCDEGYKEGRHQRLENEPQRNDCNNAARPEKCKEEFDKCDQLQGPRIEAAKRQCRIDALKKFLDEEDTSEETADCDMTFNSPLSWIACPIIDMGVDMTDGVFRNIIQPMLESVPITANPEEGTYKAWQQFRLIANVLLVGSLLMIVYSQAKGPK